MSNDPSPGAALEPQPEGTSRTVDAPTPAAVADQGNGHGDGNGHATSHGDPAHAHKRFWTLAVASIGVVFGDIGTSPLYAFKESIAHMTHQGEQALAAADVYGVISMMLWSLILIVFIKYVVILLRMDNHGEGGSLSLLALVQSIMKRRTPLMFALAVISAGMFFGDAMLTPAVSVLSAVEGLKVIPGMGESVDRLIVPAALAIIVALFLVQRFGTGAVGSWFGPICLVWFLAMGALGIYHILDEPRILSAISPHHMFGFFTTHPGLAFVVLGSVFLTVTGAEALYADMGHFGRGPITTMWIWLVMPCLALNYFGQGALVLSQPDAVVNPFFLMAPDWLRLPLVGLAALATIIASQAVITGAYSLTQQAIQLGLLPRMKIVNTSAEQRGQIYMPGVNYMLLIGVVLLVVLFQTSSNLAHAYGLSVIGAMISSTVLAFLAMRLHWRWSLLSAAAVLSPFLLIEGVFLAANLTKVASGGYVPLALAAALMLVMWTWVRGSRFLIQRTVSNDTVEQLLLGDKAAVCADGEAPQRIKGTAVFLTQTPDSVPSALVHNLKHNKVLHERNIMLTLRTAGTPRVADDDKIEITEVGSDVYKVTMRFGYMETPNVVRGIGLAKRKGLSIDTKTTSFFVSRHTLLANARIGMPLWQDHIFIFLHRNAVRASEFFHIPTSRVVELGSQMMV